LNIISLGWGIQSFSLAAMAALDELPRPEACLFADTGYEQAATYAFAAKWTTWLEAHGLRVVTVQAEDDKRAIIPKRGAVMIPAFSDGNGGGQLRRQCTNDWKIQPIRRWLRAQGAKQTDIWLGISRDEWHRAKDADVKWITHRYPLLERNLTRADCILWLERNGLEQPPKSACVFCPYVNNKRWEAMKRGDGADWRQAVSVDTMIREAQRPGALYLHRRLKPLSEAVRIAEDEGMEQRSLIDEECDSGFCFT